MEIYIDHLLNHGGNCYTMADKICLIRQPAGLGDILFCQKIADKIKNKYNIKVLWPVIDGYSFLKNELKTTIEFCSVNSNFSHKNLFSSKNIIDNNEVLYIPLQDADQYYPGLCMMDAKYKFLGLKIDNWQEYLFINRNKEKEDKLKQLYNISSGDEYVVLNRNYGCLPNFNTCRYLKNFSSKYKTIEITPRENFSLFNWSAILEGAKEIHTVDTSIMYLMEKLNLTGKLYCYSRYYPANFSDVTHLFKTKWQYITNCN